MCACALKMLAMHGGRTMCCEMSQGCNMCEPRDSGRDAGAERLCRPGLTGEEAEAETEQLTHSARPASDSVTPDEHGL